MAKYRNALPQLGGDFFLTDGGTETTLIFHDKLELPDFAAFDLLKSAAGTAALRKYFRAYGAIARLGYSRDALATANRKSIDLLEKIRSEFETDRSEIVISGCVGPRGDGYRPASMMSTQEAEHYHRQQIEIFAGGAADMVGALTVNYVEEAVGIARAAQQAGMPVAISFTVETDGALPTGQTLQAAIEQVDEATASYPCYYMINCAHPIHFAHVLSKAEPWVNRIRGLRANASRRSHSELNESSELDVGDPVELGAQYAQLKETVLPNLNVMGGCRGTDQRHVEAIAKACAPLFRSPTSDRDS